MRRPPRLAIVVPCFNEEEVLPQTIQVLKAILLRLIQAKKVKAGSFLLFVDDGSIDRTWEILGRAAKKEKVIKALKLSRNFGHQNALLAGMDFVAPKCDCCVSIDADLQQDPQKIEEFVDKYREGFDLVLGIRTNRKSDSLFKKTTAVVFYRLMKLLGVNVIPDHADYRLLSQRVLQEVLKFSEGNLFLRGIVSNVGFKRAHVYYEVKKRVAGKSKYSVAKMISFAWTGITSFSTVPLRLITFLGILIFILSGFMSIYVLYIAIFTKRSVPGWASTVLPLYMLGGLQFLALGIVGEYLARIYQETKKRPRYIIEEQL
ncbi:MAG: glycosyltransferase family 2 protein [Leptospiraceae bacterium]|nr:glycosyltransferase family 2 protein [Leptospiraceae bacterium]MDW8305830.1 glycosyltransferase family 2 protein [Leptospiraceae bacterium]